MAPPMKELAGRRWPLVATVALLVAFTLFHVVIFGDTARRYQKALANARTVGLVGGPGSAPPPLPPRVAALVVANSMESAAAQERAESGALASDMLAEATVLAARHGMNVEFSEPGEVDQKPSSVEIHAHFRLSGKYGQFLEYLDDLERAHRLFALERFTITAPDRGPVELELWMSRLILKRGARRT
jgi:hypothetical protein